MRWLNLLKANTKKEYIELKRYLPNTIAMLLTFYIIFVGMFAGIQLIGDPSTQDSNIQYAIVNYIFWFLSFMVINSIGYEIINEAMKGTLEQLSMSPMGMWRIMTVRLISTTFINLVIVIVLLYLSMATAGQWLNIDVITIAPILLLTVISMFGVGFIIAGISIILKQVQAFLQILQFILMALTFIPLSVSPVLAFLPFVQGIDMVREVMIHGAAFNQLQVGDFMILGFNALFYFAIGIGVFLYCERVAMKKGLMAHY
ncbi:ABC transporter permease [Oceanobacillus profundus]|uniref:ABC transporter permease n=1 Tax=Oceanobacillus profundus TaxID=372463 RepID=A0A417YL78_9BACI|nr:ABC transporter permease [Oceanobacillus profundus]MBR3121815.1 ABC transporter permease [Oceanobacillus sp.]MDO6450385.1 ABC transporter permease [Oceanobacillus profundus]PAE29413.1 ABC transporter [Paenibacillus sp. 7884-2]RHW34229.1 ABC transporter permease [Oceanobacillus profundus]